MKLLNEVNDSDMTPQEYLNETHHSAVPLIGSLLCEMLITKDGGVDYDAKEALESHGFPVYPVERDGFGWLVGAVLTSKGAITFG